MINGVEEVLILLLTAFGHEYLFWKEPSRAFESDVVRETILSVEENHAKKKKIWKNVRTRSFRVWNRFKVSGKRASRLLFDWFKSISSTDNFQTTFSQVEVHIYVHVCFSFRIRINYTPRDGVLNALLISLYYVSNASVVQTRRVIELASLAVFALSGFHVKLAVDGVWTHGEVLRWEVPIIASVSVLRR